jgi:hypothetical protein
VMPPASLSTLAVMIPGPTTARNMDIRVQSDLGFFFAMGFSDVVIN